MDRLSSELLGFEPDARVLIVNCDDFGLHDAVNAAVVESIETGIASSCSLMVPCPAAADAMRLLRERPHIPFGIHLALIRDSPELRWGPVAAKADVPSLLDPGTAELYVDTPAQRTALLAAANPTDVERELRAQIDTVVDGGLAPTHLDWHCLADGGRADILDLSMALAKEYGAAAVGETVPVEVRRCQASVDHGVDLCAQLAFDLGRIGRCEERGALGRRIDVELGGVGVEQRGHVGLGGDRTPAQLGRIADEREVDAERNVRAFAQQPHRVRRRWARNHQAAGARNAGLDRLHHGSVDRVVHAEVVAVDDQHPRVRFEAQQLARQSIHGAPVCPTVVCSGQMGGFALLRRVERQAAIGRPVDV